MTTNTTRRGPLAPYHVVDLTRVRSGPTCVRQLADWGADVIKIESPPGLDLADSWGDKRHGPDFQNLHRNKRAMTLNLKDPDGIKIFRKLTDRGDVVVENFRPGTLDGWGITRAWLQEINPRLTILRVTGFGQDGPYRDRPGFDITAYFGRSGILDAARYEDGPPGISLPAQGDRATAMTLVAAILLGLRRRDRTGKGGWVGTSLYANGVWANGTSAAGALVGAKLPARQAPDKPRNALTNLYRTRDDRWLQLLVVRDDRMWGTLCDAVGQPDLATDPRFTDREERKTRSLELVRELMPVFASKTYAEWEAILSKTGIPFGVIGRVADVVTDAQAEHAGLFAATTNPEVPHTVNNPIRLGFARPRTSGPPPAVGEHNDAVLREAGFDDSEIAALKKSGALG